MIEYPNGPWKNLFEGIFDSYPLRMLINENGFLITEILNKNKTKAIINTSKITYTKGDIEAFAESMQKDSISIMIHTPNNTNKFVFFTLEPEVINIDNGEAKELINNQFKLLERNSKITSDIADSYDIKLISLDKITNDIKKTLFVNPAIFSLLIKTITTNKQIPEITKEVDKKIIEKEIKNTIKLGFYKNKDELSKEPLDEFKKTYIITNKSEKTKKQMIQIIAEEFSTNDIPVLIFTTDNSMENLKYPAENAKEIQEKLNQEPTGFPYAIYDTKTNTYGDIEQMPKTALKELYFIGENPISELIINAMDKAKELKEIKNKIKEKKPDDKYTMYLINQTSRILHIIEQIHPKLYGGSYDISTFKKVQKFGKINALLLDEKDIIKNLVNMHNIIKKTFLDKSKIAIIIDNANNYLNREKFNSLQEEILEIFCSDSNNFYFAFVPSEIDLNKKIIKCSTTAIQIISDDDIALNFKNGKPYRISLRPTISKKI
jgi:hypothetical protein